MTHSHDIHSSCHILHHPKQAAENGEMAHWGLTTSNRRPLGLESCPTRGSYIYSAQMPNRWCCFSKKEGSKCKSHLLIYAFWTNPETFSFQPPQLWVLISLKSQYPRVEQLYQVTVVSVHLVIWTSGTSEPTCSTALTRHCDGQR